MGINQPPGETTEEKRARLERLLKIKADAAEAMRQATEAANRLSGVATGASVATSPAGPQVAIQAATLGPSLLPNRPAPAPRPVDNTEQTFSGRRAPKINLLRREKEVKKTKKEKTPKEPERKFDNAEIVKKINAEIAAQEAAGTPFSSSEEKKAFTLKRYLEEKEEFNRQQIEASSWLKKPLKKFDKWWSKDLEKTPKGKALKTLLSTSLIGGATILGAAIEGVPQSMSKVAIILGIRVAGATGLNMAMTSGLAGKSFEKLRTLKLVDKMVSKVTKKDPAQTEEENKYKKWLKDKATLQNALMAGGITLSFALSGPLIGGITVGGIAVRRLAQYISDKKVKQYEESALGLPSKLEDNYDPQILADNLERIGKEYEEMAAKIKMAKRIKGLVTTAATIGVGIATAVAVEHRVTAGHQEHQPTKEPAKLDKLVRHEIGENTGGGRKKWTDILPDGQVRKVFSNGEIKYYDKSGKLIDDHFMNEQEVAAWNKRPGYNIKLAPTPMSTSVPETTHTPASGGSPATEAVPPTPPSANSGPATAPAPEVTPVVEAPLVKPETIAMIHKGEGIEHAFRRQIEADTDLAKKLGFEGDINDPKALHQFSGGEAHRLALRLGYVDETGQHQVGVMQAEKVAYEVKLENGQVAVTEKTIDGKILAEYKEGKEYKFGENPNNPHDKEFATPIQKSTAEVETPKPSFHISDKPNPFAETPDNSFHIGDPYTPNQPDSFHIPNPYPPVQLDDSHAVEDVKKELYKQYGNKELETSEMPDRVGRYDTDSGKIHSDGSEAWRERPIDWHDKKIERFVGDNPSDLGGEQMLKAYNAHNSNIEQIRHDGYGLKDWNRVKTSSAAELLGKNFTKENRLEYYIHTLRDMTGLKPKTGFIGFGKETTEHYLARALQEVTKMGNLDEVNASLRKNY